jgi:putative Holliday junction resolvase
MRSGIRLGIDPGQARIGTALSDPSGILATPLQTVRVDGQEYATLCQIVVEQAVDFVIVGLPLSLSGAWTESTRQARDLATKLSTMVTVPVRMIDERLTTTTANRTLRATGTSQRAGRSVIDQIAAVTLLQQALDSERQLGREVGWSIQEVAEMNND